MRNSRTAIKASSRRQQEQQQQRRLLIAASIVGAVILLLLGYALLTHTRFTQAPVAQVELPSGEVITITRGEFHARVTFERARYRELAQRDVDAAIQLADTYGFGQMTLERLLYEPLISAAATAQGFTVPEADIDAYFAVAYGFSEPITTTATAPTLEPTAAAQFRRTYQEKLRTYRISERELRAVVRITLLEQQLHAALGLEGYADWLEAQRARLVWLAGWDTDIPATP